jgi:hypothetical protein
MLAMALFLERYIKSSMTSVEKDKLESAWLQRWQERLGNPSWLPRKVMMAYLEDMDITPEVLDEQMEWDCWPMGDGVEELAPTQDGNKKAVFCLGYDPIRCIGSGHTPPYSPWDPPGITLLPSTLSITAHVGRDNTIKNATLRPTPEPPPQCACITLPNNNARRLATPKRPTLVEYSIPLDNDRACMDRDSAYTIPPGSLADPTFCWKMRVPVRHLSSSS